MHLIAPEWAVGVQLCLVEAEIVVVQKAFKSWKYFYIVVIVDRVHTTTAIIDGAFELQKSRTR